MLFAPSIALAITFGFIAGQSSQSASPPATQNKASADQPPVDIITYKIGPEYYAILDSPSSIAPSMAAENAYIEVSGEGDYSTGVDGNRGVEKGEWRRRQGRIHSSRSSYEGGSAYGPDLFQVVIKNTSAKSIKAVEWDFLFSHCENGQFVLRYDVTTRVKIKPRGKKTLKSKMPIPGHCAMPQVSGAEIRKQERVSIKRIDYVDGSVWQRQ